MILFNASYLTSERKYVETKGIFLFNSCMQLPHTNASVLKQITMKEEG